MPIFEYICKECNHEFEALVFGRDKAICPKCKSKSLSLQL
jgi:putative FmdB family regulatory protein